MKLSRVNIFICLIFFIMSCTTKQKESSETKLNMIVGTYTGSGSEGIYICSLDTVSGKQFITDSISQENPSFISLSPDKKYLYAVTENEDSTAGVTAYNFYNGKLTKLNSIAGLGSAPCNIATNCDEIATAEYGGGSMTRYLLNSDGSIGKLLQHTIFKGNSVDKRAQLSPHIHSVIYNEDGNLYISDLGCDKIYVQKDSTIIDTLLFEPNFGPRHFTFNHKNDMMYVIGELSGKVAVLKRYNGSFKTIQYILSDLTDGVNGKGSADIHISNDGKFLYTSNRLKSDGITIFSILPDGTLKMAGYMNTGIHPRNFAITPDDKWLVVTCRDSNSIEFYERNRETGLLTPRKEFTIKEINKPVFVTFF